MKTYKQFYSLPSDNMFEKLEGLTGKECYDKYGLKEDECLQFTLTFPNNYQVDLKMCVCGEEYLTFAEAILYNEKGQEVTFTEPTDSVIGEWWLEDVEGNQYEIFVESEG